MRPLGPTILTVSVPPHRHCGVTVRTRTFHLLLALLPAAAMAAYTFGLDAVRVMCLSMAVAVFAEIAADRAMERSTDIDNLNALFVGLCFAFLLPASAPWWLVALGSAASIVVGKAFFGPLGGSPFCAPLVGWAICRVSWPGSMDLDASMLDVDMTYPLAQLKHFGLEAVRGTDFSALLAGRQLGGLGAVQVAGVLLGGAYLLARRHIQAAIPAGFLLGVAAVASLFQAMDPGAYASAGFHLLTGSVLFGAFFLATDGPSSPNRQVPMLLFGLLAGAMTVIIRVYGAYPDGVPFAILLANLLTPTLERIRPRPFGTR
jgi:electron transport complex protein RnfD